jgi:hypothetical protein
MLALIFAVSASSETPWKSYRGVYGLSREAISSSVSSVSNDATASSIWAVVLAPTSGAVTTGRLCSQASAIWARLTPRSAAMVPTASMIALFAASSTGV